MSDLFHEAIDQDEIAMIFAVRMAMLLQDPKFWDQVDAEVGAHGMDSTDLRGRRRDGARATRDEYGPDHPLPDIWLGVSVENQEEADRRIPHLLRVPTHVRFLSREPLQGPLDLRNVAKRLHDEAWDTLAVVPAFVSPGDAATRDGIYTIQTKRIRWVIAGGKCGQHARSTHPDWVRSLRDQCATASVPYFFKRWGAYVPARPVHPLEDRPGQGRRPHVQSGC